MLIDDTEEMQGGYPEPNGLTIAEINGLKAEIERLTAELHQHKETYCAYCGERFPLDAPDSSDEVTKHIYECPSHPLQQSQAESEARSEVITQLAAEIKLWKEYYEQSQARVARLTAVLKEVYDAWDYSWDCSRDPGHFKMGEPMDEAGAALAEEKTDG